MVGAFWSLLCEVMHTNRAEKSAKGKSNNKALTELSGSSPGFRPTLLLNHPMRLAKAEGSPTSLPVCQGDNWPNYPSCSKKTHDFLFLCLFFSFLFFFCLFSGRQPWCMVGECPSVAGQATRCPAGRRNSVGQRQLVFLETRVRCAASGWVAPSSKKVTMVTSPHGGLGVLMCVS